MKRTLAAMYIKLLVFFLVFGMIGCAGISKYDKVTEPSLLIETARKYEVRLEDIGNALIVANGFAIGEGVYTKEQALTVLEDLLMILDNPVSYAFFKSNVYEKIDKYPGLYEVSETYFAEISSTRIMYSKDREILKEWIGKRIESLKRG